MAKTIFFLGKGGVGKTTVSALSSYFLSQYNRVELYSLDQAHNLGDVFNIKLSDTPSQIRKNLFAAEVDLNYWQKNYVNNLKSSVKKSYAYLTAYNLLSYLDLFEYAPDIEELALILAVNQIWLSAADSFIVFDMPPTALSIQFFKSVHRNIIWLDKLIALRKKIKEKREILSQVQLGKKTIETDKILNKLLELQDFYQKFNHNLQQSKIIVIQNPDQLSQLEAKRILDNLKELNLTNFSLITNKAQNCQTPLCINSYHSFDFERVTSENQEFFNWLKQMLIN